MSYPTYLRYEVLRNFRNWRFLILALAVPLVLYLLVSSVNRHVTFEHISFPVYFMTAMATLGTMAAVLSGSAVIAAERATGWTRQMRITPLPALGLLPAKVVVGYLRAGGRGAAGPGRDRARGAAAGPWLVDRAALFGVGLIPFATGGIRLGYLIGADAAGPAVGGIVTLFALLGGVYGFEVASSGPIARSSRRCAHTGWCKPGRPLGGHDRPLEGWIVVAAWTVVLVPLAVRVYRRGTG